MSLGLPKGKKLKLPPPDEEKKEEDGEAADVQAMTFVF